MKHTKFKIFNISVIFMPVLIRLHFITAFERIPFLFLIFLAKT